MYKHLVGLGKQPLSTAPCAARTHFGSAQRFKSDSKMNVMLNTTPGAGQYASHKSALGKQVYSKKKTLPAYGFGTSTRMGMQRVRNCHTLKVLCPYAPQKNVWSFPNGFLEAYLLAHTGGIRIEVEYCIYACRCTSQLSMRKGSMDKGLQVLILHVKSHAVRCALFVGMCNHVHCCTGPMTARPKSAFRQQVNSSKSTSPSFGFGTSKRNSQYGNPNPGPGTYCA